MAQSNQETFLITVNSEIDSVIVQDILKQNGIPFLKRHKGMGDILLQKTKITRNEAQ